MKICRVTRQVVSTQKHPFYHGRKTFLVQAIGPQGKEDAGPYVAVDRVQAGVGDLVLLMQEGSSARFMFGDGTAPVRSVIVGIVDRVDLDKNADPWKDL